MLRVSVLAVGKLKEPWLAAAVAEYAKRMKAFCRLELMEVEEARLPQDPSEGEIRRCLEAEGLALLAKVPPRCALTALCIEGKELSSPGLAERIAALSGIHSHLAFAIGGSHGLSQEVKDRADLRLSFSPMTFPHQLARVMLLEQLYRSFSILGNRKYHK